MNRSRKLSSVASTGESSLTAAIFAELFVAGRVDRAHPSPADDVLQAVGAELPVEIGIVHGGCDLGGVVATCKTSSDRRASATPTLGVKRCQAGNGKAAPRWRWTLYCVPGAPGTKVARPTSGHTGGRRRPSLRRHVAQKAKVELRLSGIAIVVPLLSPVLSVLQPPLFNSAIGRLLWASWTRVPVPPNWMAPDP